MTSLNVESVPDAVDFCDNLGLMLKPIAKMQIIIKLPKLTIPGQSISNWDLMERMKKAIVPMQLEAIRVRESSLEVVVFEAEALTKSILKQSMKMLDGLSMKVSGFSEPLRIKASEAKLDFPTRHDWDLFYMKNRLDENKPGERPDTIYLSRVPVKWFNDGIVDGPSESLLKKAMSGFGTVRIVDIPICDPLRIHLTPKISGIQCRGFGFGQEVFFEAYVQFEEYKGFMTAMACLRNMKWLKRIEGKLFQADVKVDFDRTRHLSEAQMERRKAERERLLMDRRKLQDEETRVRLEEEKRLEQLQQEKERRREEREQKRKEKREQERLAAEIEERSRREAEEERKAAKQLRIVQAQRLLENVFSRIQQKEERRVAREKAELHDVANEVKSGDLDLESREQKLREMLLKQRELRMREQMKERLAKSVKSRSRSSSLSSEPERREEKRSRKKKKHHKNEKKHRHHKKRRRSSS